MSVYGRSVWPLSSTTLIWFLNCLLEGTGLILQNTSILNVVFLYLSLTTHSIHNSWTKYRWSDTEKVHGLIFVVLRSVSSLLGADTEWKISTNQHKQSSWCIYLKDNKKICILTLTLWIWLSQGTPVMIKHVYSLHPQFRRIKRVCTQPSALDSWLWKELLLELLSPYKAQIFQKKAPAALKLLFFFQQLKMRWFLLFSEWLMDWARGTYWYLFGRRSGLCKTPISPQSSLAIDERKKNRVLRKGK